MLYKDSYYVYNYSRKDERIVCRKKIAIEGNEERIAKYERGLKNGTNKNRK